MVKPLSAAAGLLLALCIGIGARLETGTPPGLPPKPFAHLLGRQAPDFTLPGLGGETVSLSSAGGTDAWVLYFTDAACGACKAAYPAVAVACWARRPKPRLAVTIGLRGASSTGSAQCGARSIDRDAITASATIPVLRTRTVNAISFSLAPTIWYRLASGPTIVVT